MQSQNCKVLTYVLNYLNLKKKKLKKKKRFSKIGKHPYSVRGQEMYRAQFLIEKNSRDRVNKSCDGQVSHS